MTHVNAVLENIEVYGNPFEACSPTLETLVTKFQFGELATQNLRNAFGIGKKQYNEFVERIISKPKTFFDAVKTNNLLIFKEKPPAKASKAAQKCKLLKNDVVLFSRLYIGAKNREGA